MTLAIIPIVAGFVAAAFGVSCSSPTKKKEEEPLPNLGNVSEDRVKALDSSKELSNLVQKDPATPMRVPHLFSVSTRQPCEGTVLKLEDPSIANICLNEAELNSLDSAADLLNSTRKLNLFEVNDLLLDHMRNDWSPELIGRLLAERGAPEGRYERLVRYPPDNRSPKLIIPENKLMPK